MQNEREKELAKKIKTAELRDLYDVLERIKRLLKSVIAIKLRRIKRKSVGIEVKSSTRHFLYAYNTVS